MRLSLAQGIMLDLRNRLTGRLEVLGVVAAHGICHCGSHHGHRSIIVGHSRAGHIHLSSRSSRPKSC